MIQNLFRHRRYLLSSFWADFRFRYAGTVLGLFWFIVTPLLEAALYATVFSFLLGARTHGNRGVSYTIFLLAGLFPWFAFSQVIMRGSNTLKKSAVYLRRLAISTEVFIAREALIGMFSLVIYVLFLIPLNLAFGNLLTWHVLLVPIIIFLFMTLGFVISLSLAHVSAILPDLREVLGVFVQLWRWTLPINYSFDVFPEKIRSILIYNPPYYFITSFRDLFIDKRLPPFISWVNMIGWILILGLIGSFISSRLATDVKDQA